MDKVTPGCVQTSDGISQRWLYLSTGESIALSTRSQWLKNSRGYNYLKCL